MATGEDQAVVAVTCMNVTIKFVGLISGRLAMQNSFCIAGTTRHSDHDEPEVQMDWCAPKVGEGKRFELICMDSTMNSQGFTWTHKDSQRFTRIHKDSQGLTRIHKDSQGFTRIHKD